MAAPASLRVSSRHVQATARAFVFAALVFIGSAAHAAKWDPVNPADLADAKPQVDPEAGAEILLKTIDVEQTDRVKTKINYYIKAKIYTQRGVDEFLKITLDDSPASQIEDVAARSIDLEGNVYELTKNDIHVEEAFRIKKIKKRRTSFAFPKLKPGDIVEIRYIDVFELARGTALFFQSEFPARLVRYSYREDMDFLGSSYLRTTVFGKSIKSIHTKKDGRIDIEMRNVPAIIAEPNQPPRLNVENCLLITYTSATPQKTSERHWSLLAESIHNAQIYETVITGQIKKAAAEIIASEKNDEAKLRKIYDFCRTEIKNKRIKFIPDSTPLRDEHLPAHTLKDKEGWPLDINCLFVALARAAGLDARLARVNDRSFVFFNPQTMISAMLPDIVAAVKLHDRWVWMDPGATYLPYGMLSWENSGTSGLIAAPKDGKIVPTEMAPADHSQCQRIARLQVSAEGVLEGKVQVYYTGYRQALLKQELEDKGPGEREKFFVKEIRGLLPLAEISDMKIEGADDPLKSLSVSYRLRVPNYAERTGSRLFIKPTVFHHNREIPYPLEKRVTPLIHRFLTIDHDRIYIAPPEGYEPEEPAAPVNLKIGAAASYEVTMGVHAKTGVILCDRRWTLNTIYIPETLYGTYRAALQSIHARDNHTLILKQKAVAAAHTVQSAGALSP